MLKQGRISRADVEHAFQLSDSMRFEDVRHDDLVSLQSDENGIFWVGDEDALSPSDEAANREPNDDSAAFRDNRQAVFIDYLDLKGVAQGYE
jgi:hypothetical protein